MKRRIARRLARHVKGEGKMSRCPAPTCDMAREAPVCLRMRAAQPFGSSGDRQAVADDVTIVD
jgi:hypothetical protein